MSSKHNQLKIGVVLSYISMGANMAIQLLYTPIMIRLLGQSEYGLYTLVGSVVSYLGLFSFGFSGAYLRFYSRYRAENNQQAIARLNGMFLTLFFCMSAAALVCGLILAQFTQQLFGSKISATEAEKAKILMQILACNIALTFPASVFDSIISAYEQFFFQRLLQFASVLFNPLLCLPLLLMGYGSVAVVSITTIITVSKLALNIFFCWKKLRVPFTFHEFDRKLLKEIASFSFFLFLNMLIDQLNWSVDKFILGRISGTNAVAVYGVGAQINGVYMSFSTAISSVFAPRVNRIASENSSRKAKEFTDLFIKVGRIQFFVMGLILSGFVIFGYYFITEIFAGISYAEAYPVALWLIIPVTIPLIQNMGIDIQRAENKHQFRSIIYFIMALVNTAVSIPLSIIYGPVGSAAGTGLTIFISTGFIMNIFYQKSLGINIILFWKNIAEMVRGILIPAGFGWLILCFIKIDDTLEFLIFVLLYSGTYVISMWYMGINNEEKRMILVSIRKVFRRV